MVYHLNGFVAPLPWDRVLNFNPPLSVARPCFCMIFDVLEIAEATGEENDFNA